MHLISNTWEHSTASGYNYIIIQTIHNINLISYNLFLAEPNLQPICVLGCYSLCIYNIIHSLISTVHYNLLNAFIWLNNSLLLLVKCSFLMKSCVHVQDWKLKSCLCSITCKSIMHVSYAETYTIFIHIKFLMSSKRIEFVLWSHFIYPENLIQLQQKNLYVCLVHCMP